MVRKKRRGLQWEECDRNDKVAAERRSREIYNTTTSAALKGKGMNVGAGFWRAVLIKMDFLTQESHFQNFILKKRPSHGEDVNCSLFEIVETLRKLQFPSIMTMII